MEMVDSLRWITRGEATNPEGEEELTHDIGA